MDLKKNRRKVKEGVVVSNKMQKTVVVRIERTVKHPQFQKAIVRGKNYYAHTNRDDVEVGQKVKIIETRPLSKTKRWKVLEEK